MGSFYFWDGFKDSSPYYSKEKKKKSIKHKETLCEGMIIEEKPPSSDQMIISMSKGKQL